MNGMDLLKPVIEAANRNNAQADRSEEHTSELQSP